MRSVAGHSGVRGWVRAVVAGLVIVPTLIWASPAAAATVTLYSMTTDGAWKSTQGTNWSAQAFRVGSTPMVMTEVSVRIRNANEANNQSLAGTVSASLYEASAGAPTAVKVADLFTDYSFSGTGIYQDETITVSGLNLTLSGNAEYAVVVTGSSGSTIGWKYNATTPTSTIPGATFTYGAVSTNGGSSWSANGTNYFNMIVGAEPAPASSTDTSVPPPVIQQFGRPVAGSCAEAEPIGLDWAGVAKGGWTESWAEWMNNGRGGAVCTRTLAYSRAVSSWIVE